jgi:hypothetical protein
MVNAFKTKVNIAVYLNVLTLWSILQRGDRRYNYNKVVKNKWWQRDSKVNKIRIASVE